LPLLVMCGQYDMRFSHVCIACQGEVSGARGRARRRRERSSVAFGKNGNHVAFTDPGN
jgi:hypothetical protein